MRFWVELEEFRKDERGQGLVEYALIVLLIALVVLGGLAVMGEDVDRLTRSVLDAFL